MPTLDNLEVHTKLAPAEIRQKAQHYFRRAQLPQARRLASYAWSNDDGVEFSAMVSKRDRQILDAIINSPVFCASPIRISDSVLRLRRDHGLPILREDFTERDGGESLTSGVYYLATKVALTLPEREAA